jgi:hypothetical protein
MRSRNTESSAGIKATRRVQVPLFSRHTPEGQRDGVERQPDTSRVSGFHGDKSRWEVAGRVCRRPMGQLLDREIILDRA